MAKRITNAGVSVEQVDSTNYLRLTNAGISVEQVDAINYIRLTSVGIMVEYSGTPGAEPAMVLGPRWQWI